MKSITNAFFFFVIEYKKKYNMSKFTKIVATISDKCCDVDFVRQLFENGMNVVRMNSAHMQEEGFLRIITNVREVSSPNRNSYGYQRPRGENYDH